MTIKMRNALQHTLAQEEAIDQALGRRLKHLRLSTEMSVTEFAIRSGLPPDELADHERGLLPIPLSRTPILCEALGVSLHKLVGTAVRAHRRMK
ncbi:MAG: helix-turn-helix transcriptional regulator [Phycisphaeraceae bacterium]|nr:helix-turn-helix transcriptional regulator [Phycisphaeraceae bacterium]MBX3366194.1 helix-turn-helix transcriptional regulator [Phycisphaeraceae bacterium]